ncbi:MAG TPA: DMT family transporter [Jatrophihabitantaceae bacterium]|jgi:drug/metabolite transporter (DMT)-like permease|nr:DMT family transporter [Jatrophihabitantaceae bacterium]
MTVVLGLAAAIAYGLGDFVGAFASRRHSAVTVLLHSYPVGAVLMLLMLPAFPGSVDGRVVGFGIAGGVAGLVGVVIMYGLMVIAPMNVISPVTAVLAAIVPVIFGVLVGERPHLIAWFGIAIGIAAVLLVSRTTEDHPHGKIAMRVLALAFVAGLGFGFYFIFLARAGNDSGLWPLVISRIASALLIVPLAQRRNAIMAIRGRMLAITVLAGACDALANMFFLLASRHGLLSLASVLTSLYPAVTVILAVGLLHEHTSKVQRAGLGLAAASIVLITL